MWIAPSTGRTFGAFREVVGLDRSLEDVDCPPCRHRRRHVGEGPVVRRCRNLSMTLEGLRSELDRLSEEHGAELVRPVVEGAGHTGDGAVVQYVGRRMVD